MAQDQPLTQAKLLQDLERHWRYHNRFKRETLAAYRWEVKQFLQWLDPDGGTDLSARFRAVDDRRAAAYLATVQAVNDLADASLRRKIYALRSCFEALVQWDVVRHNPFSHLDAPDDDRLPNFLLPQQVKQLLRTIQDPTLIDDPDHVLKTQGWQAWEQTGLRDLAIVAVMIFCGLSLREVVQLNDDDLDVNNQTIRIQHSGSRHCHRQALHHIRAYVERQRPNNGTTRALFLTTRTHKRMARRSVQRMIEKWGDRAGLNRCSPTLLRNTFACRYATMNDPEDAELAKVLGLTEVRHVKRYKQAAEDQTLKKRIDQLSYE